MSWIFHTRCLRVVATPPPDTTVPFCVPICLVCLTPINPLKLQGRGLRFGCGWDTEMIWHKRSGRPVQRTVSKTRDRKWGPSLGFCARTWRGWNERKASGRRREILRTPPADVCSHVFAAPLPSTSIYLHTCSVSTLFLKKNSKHVSMHDWDSTWTPSFRRTFSSHFLRAEARGRPPPLVLPAPVPPTAAKARGSQPTPANQIQKYLKFGLVSLRRRSDLSWLSDKWKSDHKLTREV